MKKIVLTAVALLLSVALCMAFAACGDSKSDAKSEEPTEAPGYEIGASYHWTDIDFKLTKLTDDMSDYEERLSSIGTPEGKLVYAEFTITDGKIAPDALNKKMDEEAVRLSGGKYVNTISTGLSVEGQEVGSFDEIYVEGAFVVFFDVPEDYSFDDAVLTVKED